MWAGSNVHAQSVDASTSEADQQNFDIPAQSLTEALIQFGSQAQFPLHSGRILGLPGRILVSVMGVVTAALAVTGVVIWWKRRAARQRRDTPVASAHANPAE
jgi:uncharacterized iron-regulated membrane protein